MRHPREVGEVGEEESYKSANQVVCQPSAVAQDKKGTDNPHRI